MFRCCKGNGKSKKNKLGILSSLAIATIIAQAGGAFAITNLKDPVYNANGSSYNYVYYGKTGDNAEKYGKTNDPILFRVLNTKANGKANASDAENAAGTVTFTVPNLDPGNYTVEVLNEQKNAAKETNYAGEPCQVALSVTTRKAVLTATEETGGSGLWIVVADPYSTENPLATFEEGKGPKQTIVFDVPENVETVYVLDRAGNVSAPVSLTQDSTKPTAEISYANGVITVTIKDEGAGIASIDGNAQNPTVEADGYPKSVPITVNKDRASVTVVDAVGNTEEIQLDIDKDKPTITKAYKNGTKAMIMATDEKPEGATYEKAAGLWKIVETASLEAPAKVEFTGTGDELPKVFDLSSADISSVYAYDHAGNITEAKELLTDNEAPTGEVTYNEGTITLAVTDDKSGIAKIGEKTYSNYTTSVPNHNVTTGTPSVEMVDALGNATTKYIDNDAPAITKAYKNGTKAMIIATDKKEGVQYEKESGLWKIEENSASGTPAEVTLEKANDNLPKVFELSDASVESVYVYDHAGNKTAAETLLVDETAPTGTVTYDKGLITLAVEDTESGIAQIGTKTYSNYTTSETYTIDAKTTTVPAQINMVDAVGNTAPKDIDKTAPTVPEGVRNFISISPEGKTCITITATDADSGLWKVVATNSNTAEQIGIVKDGKNTGEFTGTGATQTIQFTLREGITLTDKQVYLVDHAGNVSAAVTLTEDSAAPGVTRAYVKA